MMWRTAGSLTAQMTTVVMIFLLALIVATAASTTATAGDDFHLRRRPVGVTPNTHAINIREDGLYDENSSSSSHSFGGFLRKLLSNNSGDDEEVDLRSHYPLFHANQAVPYDMNDVLFSFIITAKNSNLMSRPPPHAAATTQKRKLKAEAATNANNSGVATSTTNTAVAAHEEDHGKTVDNNLHSDALHATEEEGGHDDDAHSMVVHVTYENIYAILVFLIAATALGIVTSKLGMPALVGEIITGFLLGPPLANFVPYPEALVLVGEIGLIMLLLEAGVELDVAQLRETGARALGIGITGTILPLVIGMGLAMASDTSISIKSALAVGAAFSPTSLGVAASALKAGKMLDTPVGQLIVASCVIDDILALILLSMFQVLVEDSPPIVSYFIPIISSVGFLFVLGGSAVTWLPRFIQNKVLNNIPEPHRELTMFSIMTAMLLGYLPLLNYTKSSYLTGAFLAGATFSQIESAHHAFIEKTHQLMTWLLRVFFAASIGFQVPVTLFKDPYVIGWGFILYACVLAKFPLMCYVPRFEDVKEGARYNPFLRDRLITGLSMTCRGEFSFIIAAFALGKGLISAKIYAAIVWAVLLSCITSPFMLLSLIKYFNKLQLEYLSATNPLNKKAGSDGTAPLYLHIKATAPASWGHQELFRNILNDLDLEVIERRTNRHGRGFNASIQTDLYVKDKTMDIKFQKIAGQRRIKNALKTAMDFTEEELDTFSTALEELRLLMDENGNDEGAAFFSQFDSDNDGVVSLSELKEGLEKKLSFKLTQRQARKVMELFDASGDGSLQQNEMVSFEEFHSRLQVLMEENKKKSLQSRKTRSILANSRKSRRMSSNELSHLSLKDLEESEKTALKQDAKEQDQIIKRGAAIETRLESALGDEAEVTVEVW